MSPWIKKEPKKKKKRVYSDRKKEAHRVYSDRRWKEMRLLILQDHPLCVDCEKEGRITLAVECHHVVPFMQFEGDKREEVAYDYDNVVPLCSECHKKRHDELRKQNKDDRKNGKWW